MEKHLDKHRSTPRLGGRRRAMIALGALIAVAGSGGAIANAAPGPGAVKPVPAVNVQEYLGTWHQLAAVPQPFNLVCARDTTANYSLRSDGDVRVRNSCTTWAGTPNRIVGSASVVDKKTNAQLRVRFPGVPEWGGPGGPPNYVIVGLGPDYSWSVVTNPERTSGFVLSRTPALPRGEWAAVRTVIAKAGLSDCLFLTSPTTGGMEQTAPLCTLPK